MLTEILKEKTKEHHQQLETHIISRIKKLESTAEYVEFLGRFYGYIAPLEEKIAAHYPKHQPKQFPTPSFSRRKAEKLLYDAQSLSFHDNDFQLATSLPRIDTFEHALGAMYVLEGSTLGGKYICKMISSKLAISPEDGFTYFGSYGEETQQMWENFKDELNQASISPNAQSSILDAANETFIKFKNWLDEQ